MNVRCFMAVRWGPAVEGPAAHRDCHAIGGPWGAIILLQAADENGSLKGKCTAL